MNWLKARYLADVKARNQRILREFLSRLNSKTYTIFDISSGIGSDFRYLTQRIETDQLWLLNEDDDLLLQETLNYLNNKLKLEVKFGSIFEFNENKILLEPVQKSVLFPSVINEELDIILAHAVFSTFTLDQFMKLIQNCNDQILYFTSNYNHTIFDPSSDKDKYYLTLYDQSLSVSEELDSLMGAGCANKMNDILNQNQYDVIFGTSDWELGPDDKELALMVIEIMENNIPKMLNNQDELDEFTFWLSDVRHRIEQDNLTIMVKHDDILAFKHEE